MIYTPITKEIPIPSLLLNSYIHWSIVASGDKLQLILAPRFQDLGTIWNRFNCFAHGTFCTSFRFHKDKVDFDQFFRVPSCVWQP